MAIEVEDLVEVSVAEAARILGCGRARARTLIDSLPQTYRTEGNRRRVPVWAIKAAQERGWKTTEAASGAAATTGTAAVPLAPAVGANK